MLILMLPAVYDVSVTNVCNAACDLCSFAGDKMPVGAAWCLDAEEILDEAALFIY